MSRPLGSGSSPPVLVTPDAQAAKDQQCPSCGRKDGIRYLGSRVATLASVTLGQLFGSPDVAAEEKKTLVFTDSVQDASHRAAFVESRAYALNLRSLVHRAIGADPSTGIGATCESLGRLIEEGARSPSERYALLPTELRDHKRFRPYWTSDDPKPRTRRTVAKRMGFAGILEFGLSTGTGQTLELTGAVTAHVEIENLAAVVDAALAAGPGTTSNWQRCPATTMWWSTKARICTPVTGGCCVAWSPPGRTTCSSARTDTSGSTASGPC